MQPSNKKPDTVTSRLIRLESKLVRGFEELGIGLEADRNWLTVEDETNTVYVTTTGRSISVLLQEMKSHGARKFGEWYEVVHKGHLVATVLYNPRF